MCAEKLHTIWYVGHIKWQYYIDADDIKVLYININACSVGAA